MQQIGKGIFIEDTYLGVTVGGMVFPHGTIYVDAPLRIEDTRAWRSALMAQRGGSNRILVNLDSHLDRILGSRMMDCTVIAHQKTAQVFRNQPMIFKGQMVEMGASWEDYSDAVGIRWALPDITFQEGLSLHWGGGEVIVDHHPGPTSGACWVSIPSEGVVFTGDILVVGQTPFLAQADIQLWLENLELLQKQFKDFILVSGRGGIASTEDIKILQKGLKKVLRGMERLAKKRAAPEVTESMIPSLLEDFELPGGGRQRDIVRLKYGLYQYYVRSYHQSNSVNHIRLEEDES